MCRGLLDGRVSLTLTETFVTTWAVAVAPRRAASILNALF
jgi:hypothetical protein